MAIRTRNSAVLFKIESSEGVDAAPVAGTDAVLVENPTFSFNPNTVQTNEVTGSLDNRGPIAGGMTAQITFDVYLKGSGAAGTAPEWGKILTACGWQEVITASAVPAAPEACANGGSTTTAVLGATASSTAQAYRGMPVVFSSTVAGTAFISDYTAGKVATLTDTMSGSIVNTTNYQIPINVLYRPASTSIPSATIYLYRDGKLIRFVGCRGTGSLELQGGSTGRIRFTFTGQFLSETDASVPAGLTYDSTRPPIWRAGKALVHRSAAAMSQFTLDMGNAVTSPVNPNATEGYDPALITARNMTGQIDPLDELVATRDTMTPFRNGTSQILHARWGSATGNRVGLTVPAAFYSNLQPGDRDGLATAGLPFAATGQDAGAFICLH